MNHSSLAHGDQERVLSLFVLLVILPWLPGFLARVFCFIVAMLPCALREDMEWRKLLRSLVAPLAFLIPSCLALLWGGTEGVLEIFMGSLMACLLLLIMSRSLSGPQWMSLAQRWKLDPFLFSLLLIAKRWLDLSLDVWAAGSLGWTMRSRLSGLRLSLETMSWRLAGVHLRHEERTRLMDFGWQARGLPPVLALPAMDRARLEWRRLLRELGPPVLAYALTLFFTASTK